MTHAECMKSNSQEAIRVREILKKIKAARFPEDCIMYKIIQEEKKKDGGFIKYDNKTRSYKKY